MKQKLVAAFLAYIAFSSTCAAAEFCKGGPDVSITGISRNGVFVENGVWSLFGEDMLPCKVAIIKGKGDAPPDCITELGVILKFSATGHVQGNGAQMVDTNLTCEKKQEN